MWFKMKHCCDSLVYSSFVAHHLLVHLFLALLSNRPACCLWYLWEFWAVICLSLRHGAAQRWFGVPRRFSQRGRRYGSGANWWTLVGVSGDFNVPNGYVLYDATRCTTRWCRRSAVGENQARCIFLFLFSGLKNVRGWLKVTPELAVGLQCSQDQDRERVTEGRDGTGS